MSGCGCETLADAAERRTLVAVLAINAVMFVAELGLGMLAESTSLVADSLDMLADASVYAASLYAVGRGRELKRRAALAIGAGQLVLGLLALADVLRRVVLGSEPASALMMGVGGAALAANVSCLALLARHRHGEVHLRAALICSATDVAANLGVILSGALVWALASRFPDLVVGALIAAVVVGGGLRILGEARAERGAPPVSCPGVAASSR